MQARSDKRTSGRQRDKRNKFVINLHISQDRPLLKCLVDTGADVSLISMPLVKRLKVENQLQKATQQLSLAGEVPSFSSYCIWLPVFIAEEVVNTLFYVLPKLSTRQDVILGANFILGRLHLDATVSPPEIKIKSKKKVLSCNYVGDSGRIPVYAVETPEVITLKYAKVLSPVNLPGNSKGVVACRVKVEREIKAVHYLPLPDTKVSTLEGIYPVKCTPSGVNYIDVSYINNHPEDVECRWKARIGEYMDIVETTTKSNPTGSEVNEVQTTTDEE